MITNSQKRALARKDLEEGLKAYEEPIKYIRSLLLWQRPIELGVFLALLTGLLWYFKDTSISVVTAVFIAIPIICLIKVFNDQSQVSLLQKFFPLATSHEAYIESIRVISDVKLSISESFDHLRVLKKHSPIQFLIQVTIVCLIIAYIGRVFSGYTLFIFALYTFFILPGFIFNNHHRLIKDNIKPLVEQVVSLVEGLIKTIVNQVSAATNQTGSSQNSDMNGMKYSPATSNVGASKKNS